MSNIKKLDTKVRAILQSDEASRKSDIRLTQMIWWTYHRDTIFLTDVNGKETACVTLHDLFDLPREDNIKRIRAKIQNVEKLWLPTDVAVAKKRGWLEDEWRGYLGNAVAGIDRQTL